MALPPPAPIPRLADYQHVALFGGTFDPPHVAHVTMADLARRELERRLHDPVLLVFVPAARSPHKDNAPTASDFQRAEMVRLAIEGLEGAAVWTDELDRALPGEPSYWLRTLERAREVLGDQTLSFIIGADQASSFHRWRGPREMLSLARALVLPRAPIATAQQLRDELARADFWNEKELDRWAESFVDLDLVRAASTEVRQAQGTAHTTPMHPRVLEYARAQGLYGL